jgi:hypothetical protein
MQIELNTFLRVELLIKGLQQALAEFSTFPLTYHEKTESAVLRLAWSKEVGINTFGNHCYAIGVYTIGNEIVSPPMGRSPQKLRRCAQLHLSLRQLSGFPDDPTGRLLGCKGQASDDDPKITGSVDQAAKQYTRELTQESTDRRATVCPKADSRQLIQRPRKTN